MASYGKVNVNQERYAVLSTRNAQFHDNLKYPEREVIRVFDPLTASQLEEIQLIREVSRELQKKKLEDTKKTTAQAMHDHNEATPKENELKALGEQK